MLTATEIRRRFLRFFTSHMHTEAPSSSLVPRDDPSLLFTNAGMVQFKKVFLGQEKRPYVRATTAQKCLRVGGKHNDLDNVGRTARHHTFFEMLGNFSFGDYFKKDAIRFAWTFITEDLKLPREKLYIPIYKDDDEAFALWEKDNFWSMGDTGPCGPCSEIHFDQGEAMSCGPDCGIGTCDCDRFLEIWNLVFMQYDQLPSGERVPLPHPSIDTGMGLERMAAIMQGVQSNYETDVLRSLVAVGERLSGRTYGEDAEVDLALRIIADHSRSVTFMIADGILPGNEGRGYVLRRLLRRAIMKAQLIGIEGHFLNEYVDEIVRLMGDVYPEIVENRELERGLIMAEEDRFGATLRQGQAYLEDALGKLAGDTLSGE